MSRSVGMMKFPRYGGIKHVPNHQPIFVMVLGFNVFRPNGQKPQLANGHHGTMASGDWWLWTRKPLVIIMEFIWSLKAELWAFARLTCGQKAAVGKPWFVETTTPCVAKPTLFKVGWDLTTRLDLLDLKKCMFCKGGTRIDWINQHINLDLTSQKCRSSMTERNRDVLQSTRIGFKKMFETPRLARIPRVAF